MLLAAYKQVIREFPDLMVVSITKRVEARSTTSEHFKYVKHTEHDKHSYNRGYLQL